MELTILSPETKKVAPVAWVELNTLTGNYVILPGHAPMVVILTHHAPLIYALENGTQTTLIVTSGIAEITRSSVLVLLN